MFSLIRALSLSLSLPSLSFTPRGAGEKRTKNKKKRRIQGHIRGVIRLGVAEEASGVGEDF